MKYKILLGWVITVFFFCTVQLNAIALPELVTSTPGLKPGLAPSSVPNLSLPNLSLPNLSQGAQVFEAQCAGCHVGGGNIIRRGKNLKLKTLQKNQVATVQAIAALVIAGKGNMSAYGDRLTPTEISDVSAYVLDAAEKDWK